VALKNGALIDGLTQAYREEAAGNLEKAVEDYEALLKDANESESAVVRKHLGNLHFRMGHLRSARAYLGSATEVDAGNASLWHDLGVVEYHMADFDRAVDAFRHALVADPNLHLTYFWLGNALYHRGDYKSAASAFQELLERYPNFTIARFHLGVIYARQGDDRKAKEQFHKLLLHNPDDVAARYYVAK